MRGNGIAKRRICHGGANRAHFIAALIVRIDGLPQARGPDRNPTAS